MLERDNSHVPEHAKAGIAKIIANSTFAGKPEAEQRAIIQDVLVRALNDERLKDIADSHGLPRSVLNYNLLRLAGDEWRETQAARAVTGLEVAEDEMERAEDVLALAKARERTKAAQWRLEKLLRRFFGEEKAQININMYRQISVQDALDEAQARLVEDKTGHAEDVQVLDSE